MQKYLLTIAILIYIELDGLSMVYSFRISQITKPPIFNKSNYHNQLLALTFNEYEKKNDEKSENFLGELVSYIYIFQKHNYFRVYFAASDIKEFKSRKTIYSGAETDDILFKLGHNITINDNSTVTFSGLLGIPTHQISRLKHPEFGYGQLGIGGKIDGLYELDNKQSVYYAARAIYFVPRNALTNCSKKYKFTVGSLEDLLIGYRKAWEKYDFEFGYNLKAQIGAKSWPYSNEIIEKNNYIRSLFYTAYKYKFNIKKVPNRIILDFTYGFDHNKKPFNSKYILSGWIAWDINF